MTKGVIAGAALLWAAAVVSAQQPGTADTIARLQAELAKKDAQIAQLKAQVAELTKKIGGAATRPAVRQNVKSQMPIANPDVRDASIQQLRARMVEDYKGKFLDRITERTAQNAPRAYVHRDKLMSVGADGRANMLGVIYAYLVNRDGDFPELEVWDAATSKNIGSVTGAGTSLDN